MLKEFKDFILKGNMFDLAVGVIIAGAFGKVVTEFTGLLLKLIALVSGGKEVSGIMIPGTNIALDGFINAIISLIIVGFVVFMVVKAYNKATKRDTTPAKPADVALLEEIRDLLKK